MTIRNQLKMSFPSNSENVGISRITAAAFAAQVNLTLSELEEIKVAVSEAVSNAVVHGYADVVGCIEITMTLYEDRLEYSIVDYGKGIEDVELARKPSYSSDPDRMGLGFVFMESFMDELVVESIVGRGTTVKLIKKLQKEQHAH